jgi:hypothetical protein
MLSVQSTGEGKQGGWRSGLERPTEFSEVTVENRPEESAKGPVALSEASLTVSIDQPSSRCPTAVCLVLGQQDEPKVYEGLLTKALLLLKPFQVLREYYTVDMSPWPSK